MCLSKLQSNTIHKMMIAWWCVCLTHTVMLSLWFVVLKVVRSSRVVLKGVRSSRVKRTHTSHKMIAYRGIIRTHTSQKFDSYSQGHDAWDCAVYAPQNEDFGRSISECEKCFPGKRDASSNDFDKHGHVFIYTHHQTINVSLTDTSVGATCTPPCLGITLGTSLCELDRHIIMLSWVRQTHHHAIMS